MTQITPPPAPDTGAAQTRGGTGDGGLSTRVVDRLGRALARRGFTRRGFLSRVAVVGSALALDPTRYVLRPGTAYAQVCGEGASCDSGWTAFCCSINDGANTCPPGSYVAGWWRIDDSPFCLGSPRYVIDCNREPDASCSCRCADGSCDQRRVCCNNFRYGQCNTQIAGVTEVVCRVVTCTAPWEWDPACGRTVRTDPRTVTHNAPCLPGRDATPIDVRYQDLGLTGSILGAATTPERDGPEDGRYRRYDDGSIWWTSATGANAVYGAFDRAYRDLGDGGGVLGYPRSEARAVGDDRGLEVRFEHGTIYRAAPRDEPAVAVLGLVDRRYRRELDGPRGQLGYPRETQRRGGGSITRFEHGNLAAAAGGGAVRVSEAVLAVLDEARGGPDDPGLPVDEQTTADGARIQPFERGIVVADVDGELVAVNGDLARRYQDEGGASGALGRPTHAPAAVADGRGRWLRLEGGVIVTSERTGTRLLDGEVLDAYRDEGGPDGSLGLPTSDAVETSTGQRRASFEGGAIVAGPGGEVRRLAPRAGSDPSELSSRTPSGGSRREQTDPSELFR